MNGEFVVVVKVRANTSREADVETSIAEALLASECVVTAVVDISATAVGGNQ